MNHITDAVIGTAIMLTLAAGAMFAVQPRPKPEQPAESKQEAVADDRVKAEPQPPRADEQRKIDQLSKDVRAVESDIKEIKAAIRIRQAADAAKALPQE